MLIQWRGRGWRVGGVMIVRMVAAGGGNEWNRGNLGRHGNLAGRDGRGDVG